MNLLKLLLLLLAFIQTEALIPDISKKTTTTKFFPTIVEERQERLAARKKEKAELQAQDKELINTINSELEQLKQEIAHYEQLLKIQPDNELIKQKLEFSLERAQALTDLKYARGQIIALMDESNKLDQEYLADPDFKKLTKSYLERETFSFDENLIPLYEEILRLEKEQALLLDQENTAAAELQNRKRAAQLSLQTYQKKEGELNGRITDAHLNQAAKADLQALKEKVITDRKEADAMKLKEAENKFNLIQTKLFNVKRRLEELREILRIIKPQIKVSEGEIALALDEIDKKKLQARAGIENYRQEIETLVTAIKNKERELDALAKRYNIQVDADLNNWSKEPKNTGRSHLILVQIGTLNEELQLLQYKRYLAQAQMTLEEQKLRDESLRIEVKETFYKIINGQFSTDERLTQTLQNYQIQKNENKTALSLLQEQQNTIAHLITSEKKALENLNAKIANVDKKSYLFKDSALDFEQYIALLKLNQEKTQEQIDILNKITGLNTEILSKINHIGKYLDFTILELSSITPWGRPEHAISWEGIRNIIPDIVAFFKDLKNYTKMLSVASFTKPLKESATAPGKLFTFMLIFILLMFALAALKKFLPAITQKLMFLERVPFGVRWVSISLAVILGFLMKHLVSFVIWITLFTWLLMQHCTPAYLYILFCLGSIPYLIYLANRFLHYLVSVNEKYDYILLSKEYQNRFIYVLATFLYATIVIVFFREAFIAGNYYKSELPTILLAINFIIFQIGAILLLSKDQILSLISTRSDFGKWVYDLIDHYYYLLQLFLIAVIVMSNPYVGYGPLVLYILKRLFYTAILVQLLIWLHDWFKRFTSHIFFYFDPHEEVARDRFTNARTLYGLLVVFLFTGFAFIGLLIAAHIWHWPDVLLKIRSWSDVMGWIRTPFLLENTASAISVYTIFKILGFILAGTIIAFAINRFVLGRIFDILLVDSGIQNTITSLIKYIIIITSVILGFNSVGLGELVWYLIGGLVLGIGWVIKDPAADLIAYFIIIVQRPIKVGDYIFLDQENFGVVRRITPRSVEIRKKNSNTIIIPNTRVTTTNIANWNHARGFIAFDDILLTIPYKADPDQVRDLMRRVLDESRVILKNPPPVVRLENFTDLGFVFLVRGYISSNHTLDMWDIASDIRLALVKKLREHNIDIAYPVRIIVTNSGHIKAGKESSEQI